MRIILCYDFGKLDERLIEGDCTSDGPHGSQSRQKVGDVSAESLHCNL